MAVAYSAEQIEKMIKDNLGNSETLAKVLIDIMKSISTGLDDVKTTTTKHMDEMNVAIKGLQQQQQQPQQQQPPLQPEARSVRMDKDDAQETRDKGGEGNRKWSDRTPLSKLKGIENVPSFSGVKGEFTMFCKKLLNFLAEQPKLRQILKEVTKEYREEPIDEEVMDQLGMKYDSDSVNVEAYSCQLHNLLISLTTGTAFEIVDGALVEDEEGNGIRPGANSMWSTRPPLRRTRGIY